MAVYEIRIHPEHHSRKCVFKFTASDTDNYKGKAQTIINTFHTREGCRYWVDVKDVTTKPHAPVTHYILQCRGI